MSNIPKIKFKNNQSVDQLGLGTWKMTGDTCVEAVKTALDLGYRHIDTALAYENHPQISKALSESGLQREDIFLTSKIWMKEGEVDALYESYKENISDLNTDYLDLILIHWPDRTVKNWENVFLALKRMQDEGLVKSIGVSNFTINHLKDAFEITEKYDIEIVNNQVEYHPGLNQEELRNFCTDNNIVITAYSPLARGKVFDEPTLKRIAEKQNKSVAQISLAWLAKKDMIVIPKASSKEHIKTNLDIFDINLSPEEIKEIDDLGNDDRLVIPPFADFDY
jgi:diketogulonate reductase-like aldo/keto reductase